MKGMILVAGEGSRARPLTEFYAKPALPIPGGTILSTLLAQLKANGISDAALNLHHLPHTIMDAVENNPLWNISVTPFDEPVLAGSGGGFYRIRDFFENSDFIILNGDTITDADLHAMADYHKKQKNMVTFLAVPDHSGSVRVIDTDDSGRITAVRKQPKDGAGGRIWQFCGVMAVSPDMFDFFPDKQAIDLFDDVIIPLLQKGRFRGSVYAPEFTYLEFGTPEDYYSNCFKYLQIFFPKSETYAEFRNIKGNSVHIEACIEPSADISNSYIGKGSWIENDVTVRESIIYKSAISAGSAIEKSIILADYIPEKFTVSNCIVLPDLRKIGIK